VAHLGSGRRRKMCWTDDILSLSPSSEGSSVFHIVEVDLTTCFFLPLLGLYSSFSDNEEHDYKNYDEESAGRSANESPTTY